MNKSKYLIIGSGVAAVSAIESIRKIDTKSPVTVITKEKIAFYSRPLISYWLAGEIAAEKIRYRQDDFIKKKSITLITNSEAIHLDTKNKTVAYRGKNGKEAKIIYEKLLIACGGTPLIPENIKNLSNNFTFTTIEDAQKIDTAIKNGAKTSVVIGGGFIGLKAAEALKKRGLEVSVVELADFVLPTLLDKNSSKIFQENLKSHGIEIFTKDTVEKVLNIGKNIKLKSGKILKSDIIVSAIGVSPQISAFKSSGLEIERGIVVNKFMQTSAKDVYAAGDVAEAMDILTKKNRPIPIWPLASRQGAIAGENMAGLKMTYQGGLSMNSVEVFGLPVIAAGTTADETHYDVLIASDKQSQKYKKLVFDGKQLIGYIMLGNVERAGIYTELIKTRADVSKFKKDLISENFGFISVGEETWKKKITPIEI